MELEEDGDCKKEEWARIQENTFTRWVNHQLSQVNPALFDVYIDIEFD